MEKEGEPSRPVSRILYSDKVRVVTIHLASVLPPRSSDQPGVRARRPSTLYSVLLRVGFSQPAGHPAAGELLPHHFTLTLHKERYVSVALSVGSPLLGVTQHPAWWSSDFPPRFLANRSGHPVYLVHYQLYLTAKGQSNPTDQQQWDNW